MRLTLRTMLAYMDDILEPADAEDIGGKIADSEFATGLMTRVRDVTRRMRLGAPKLRGRAIGIDPNTVAEYLDNTLSPERIPEFEKICLESDVHLAEVASSHQILALVLGEPAEVTQNCRDRMYHLVHHQHVEVEPEETVHEDIPLAPRPVETPAADQNGETKSRPEVPQYLREIENSRGLAWQMALAAALLVLLGGATWMAIRPDQTAPRATADANAPVDALANLPGRGNANDPEAGANAAGVASATALEQPADLTEPANSSRRAADIAAKIDPPLSDTTPSEALDSDGRPPAPDDTVAANPLDAAASPDQRPGPSSGDPVAETPGAQPDLTSAAPSSDIEETAASEPADVGDALGAAPVSPVGRVTTNRQVLLAVSASRNEWRRAGSNATVYSGDTLLSPPTYRSTVALRAGITMEMLGGSQVTLLAPDVAGVAGIALGYGRVVLMNIDAAGAPLRIVAPGMETILTFAAGESAVAIEAVPVRNEGMDPELAAPQWDIDLYAVSGQIDWQSATPAAPDSLLAPAHRRIVGVAVAKPLTVDDFPTWIVADRLKPIEQKASDALEQALRGDRAIRLSLREMVDDRKEEVRAIAARTLAQLEDYEPLLLTLSNPHQQAYWTEQIEQLRSAVARGPQSAAAVRQAIEIRRGKAAPKVYRLLWGYTDSQLREGGSTELVAGLDDDDLLVRVLSFWNLRTISGGRTLNYRPEDQSPAKRQPHVQKWRQRDADGLIRIGEA